MILEKFSIGHGDRFGRQGEAQLKAVIKANELGIQVVPVWNKSWREHQIVHSQPVSLRQEADQAVKNLGWQGSYYVDADHINLGNVESFIGHSNFYTLDVAEAIGSPPKNPGDVRDFLVKHPELVGAVVLQQGAEPIRVPRADAEIICNKYLGAVQAAKGIFDAIASKMNPDDFVVEISMDETAEPQSPLELLFILAAVADAGIPAQTLAPRFSGRFNKGVEYVGDPGKFEVEFRRDLMVLKKAIADYGLLPNLKLSLHSGSDKFAIYGPINKALAESGAGIHVKTAGTTWLEEIHGLAMAGGEGLAVAREIYTSAYARFDELCGPYREVIDIRSDALPKPQEVADWEGKRLAAALKHDRAVAEYNPNVRQLLHVGYKVAAEMGQRYFSALDASRDIISGCVMENLLERHLKPIFLG